MVIIGVLLILAVLLDAWRRVYSERRSGVRLKVQPESEGAAKSKRENDLAWLKELPNGGARVKRRGHCQEDGQESCDDAQPVNSPAAGDAEPQGELEPSPEPEVKPAPARKRRAAAPEAAPQPGSRAAEAADADDTPDAGDLLAGMSAERDEEGTAAFAWDTPMSAGDEAEGHEPDAGVPDDDDPGLLPRSVESEVFMLNVVARDPRGFKGGDILHILLACDLRFGDMNFFHRHEFEAGKGAIQFSVANMMRPGVFDIDNMSDFTTQGLVFFVTLPGPEDMMKAFDYMLETAQAVARNLGGDVLDESRSVLTRQALEHNRQQIRDLERRMLARAR